MLFRVFRQKSYIDRRATEKAWRNKYFSICIVVKLFVGLSEYRSTTVVKIRGNFL